MNEKHEHHRRLMVMLSLAIVGLFAALLYFGYQIFYGNSVDVIKRVEVDSTFLDDALLQQTQLIEDGLPTFEAPVTSTTSTELSEATATKPSFSYPSNWHTFSWEHPHGDQVVINQILIDSKPIQLLDGDMPTYPVSINTLSRAAVLSSDYPSFAAQEASQFTGPSYTTYGTTASQLPGGVLTDIHAGLTEGVDSYDFEELIYETATTVVIVRFSDLDSSDADNTAWEQIKNSLDFSTIQ